MTKEQFENLKRETEVVGTAHDLLKMGKFSGSAAQQLLTCQMYLQGMYKHLQDEIEKHRVAFEAPKIEDIDKALEAKKQELESKNEAATSDSVGVSA